MTKAMLETTSTVTNLDVPQQKQVSLTEILPRELFLLEPKSDPYWILKHSRAVSNSRGCKESLNEVVMGKINPMKQMKY